jgi:hypothetical protein
MLCSKGRVGSSPTTGTTSGITVWQRGRRRSESDGVAQGASVRYVYDTFVSFQKVFYTYLNGRPAGA